MLDPLFSEAYSSQAYLYSIKGENTIAECIHRNIIKLEPENANYLNNYGSFLHKLGRIEEALELYQKALKYQPNHFKALLNVARIMKTLEKTREEEIIYKRILEITEDPTVMDNLGLLYISTGRFKEGKIIYEKLRNKFSNYIYGKIHFAELLIQEKYFKQAEVLLSSINSRVNHRDALHEISLLYTQINKTTMVNIVRLMSLLYYLSLLTRKCHVPYHVLGLCSRKVDRETMFETLLD
ncbi:transmembrane and TPR repeat-containing protein 1-like [Centruroides sculpturatus]|uniref:transmembrane and TPR repeat-containing protein 1-like n=1 Tax=Centruroides sculpturatus TaxID=218467 RepID=UPI000C6E2684|nr:transmembrane and TPR repeat-containing protein 1-like [Centruroides sculpturatus]